MLRWAGCSAGDGRRERVLLLTGGQCGDRRRHCGVAPVPALRFICCSLVDGFDACQYRRVSKSSRGVAESPCCEVAPLVREPLSAQGAAELAGMLKALADPVRLRLLSVVASHTGGEACVCDISAGITVSQPTVSHHLKVLRNAGLLASERRGSWVYYRVIPEALQQLSTLLGADSPLGSVAR